MRLFLFLLLFCCAVSAKPATEIKVNQVGYPPDAPKLAIVVSTASAKDFTARRAADDLVVLSGKLSARVRDENSGDEIQIADFSQLKQQGE